MCPQSLVLGQVGAHCVGAAAVHRPVLCVLACHEGWVWDKNIVRVYVVAGGLAEVGPFARNLASKSARS